MQISFTNSNFTCLKLFKIKIGKIIYRKKETVLNLVQVRKIWNIRIIWGAWKSGIC